jgi:hypothetical protein
MAHFDGRARPLQLARDEIHAVHCRVETFANEGAMLTEQLWDAEDLPERE